MAAAPASPARPCALFLSCHHQDTACVLNEPPPCGPGVHGPVLPGSSKAAKVPSCLASQATLPLCRAEAFRSLPASVHPGGLQALRLLTTHLSASLNPAATAGPGGDSSCGAREWCQSEALRAAVPTNLQQRKDSFRLKFRAPARGTSHGDPQSQVGQERRRGGQPVGRRAGGTPSPAASTGPA